MNTRADRFPFSKPELRVIDRSTVRQQMGRYLSGRSFEVLEAGCGRKWPFEKGRHRITGIDQDVIALEYRASVRKDLDRAIVGDLREMDLPCRTYDVIYCSFVLEHLDGARQVLDKFVAALKPGGLLMVTFPDRDSVFGFFTRNTPLWVHVLYKRYIQGHRNAGKPGFPPYATYYDPVIARREFLSYVREKSLQVREEYGFIGVPRAVKAFIRVVGVLSFGRLASRHVNLMYVLQKP